MQVANAFRAEPASCSMESEVSLSDGFQKLAIFLIVHCSLLCWRQRDRAAQRHIHRAAIGSNHNHRWRGYVAIDVELSATRRRRRVRLMSAIARSFSIGI